MKDVSFTICRDCPRLLKTGSLCPPCKKRRSKVREASRPTAHQRGYNAEYYENRPVVLAEQTSCAVCGSTENLEVDHDIPLSRAGGSNDRANLIVLCRRDNRAKGNKTLAEYLAVVS